MNTSRKRIRHFQQFRQQTISSWHPRLRISHSRIKLLSKVFFAFLTVSLGLSFSYLRTTSSQDDLNENQFILDHIQYHNEILSVDKDDILNITPSIFVDKTGIKQSRENKNKTLHLYLIGERHSGTKWIGNELVECFPDMQPNSNFARHKHWFQDEHLVEDRLQHHPAIVVIMFRNVYDWVNAMYTQAHHSPAHYDMLLYNFLATPWTMKRPRRDKSIKDRSNFTCTQRFRFKEVIPCIRAKEPPRNNRPRRFRNSGWDPLYELRRDGSGLPYSSIIYLRADKIRNFLNITNYKNVHVSISIIRSLNYFFFICLMNSVHCPLGCSTSSI